MDRRKTLQQELTLDAVMILRNHPTADEVYETIHRDHPSVSRATVYRNLNVLSEEGRIRRIEIPNGPDRFDHTTERHYHVRCVGCRKLFDLPAESVPDLTQCAPAPLGLELLDYDILFKGLCPECREKGKIS